MFTVPGIKFLECRDLYSDKVIECTNKFIHFPLGDKNQIPDLDSCKYEINIKENLYQHVKKVVCALSEIFNATTVLGYEYKA